MGAGRTRLPVGRDDGVPPPLFPAGIRRCCSGRGSGTARVLTRILKAGARHVIVRMAVVDRRWKKFTMDNTAWSPWAWLRAGHYKGGRAKAWCLLKHAEVRVSLSTTCQGDSRWVSSMGLNTKQVGVVAVCRYVGTARRTSCRVLVLRRPPLRTLAPPLRTLGRRHYGLAPRNLHGGRLGSSVAAGGVKRATGRVPGDPAGSRAGVLRFLVGGTGGSRSERRRRRRGAIRCRP